MIPNTGLSGTVDYITSKMGLDGKQEATNNLVVNVNPMANFQPPTHVNRFKMLNALLCDMYTRSSMYNVLQTLNSEQSKGR